MTTSTDGYSFVTALKDAEGYAMPIDDALRKELTDAIESIAKAHGMKADFRFPGEIISEEDVRKYYRIIDGMDLEEGDE